MAGINWTMVGAIGQIISALAIISISILTYRFTTRSTRINTIKNLNDSFLSFNALLCANADNIVAANEIRSPVTGSQRKDVLFFNYLTIMHSYFEYNDSGLITKDEFESTVKGSLKFLSSITDEELISLLNEGYSTRFADFVMASRPKVAEPPVQNS